LIQKKTTLKSEKSFGFLDFSTYFVCRTTSSAPGVGTKKVLVAWHQPLGVIFFLPARLAMEVFFTGALAALDWENPMENPLEHPEKYPHHMFLENWG
jgi:hypothetical protein